MISGGVVETSDVCLDCHSVIDRDVDCLLLSCLGGKKQQDVECSISLLNLDVGTVEGLK